VPISYIVVATTEITHIARIIANETRIRILTSLSQKPMRLTNVSRSLDITPQEAKRHLKILHECKLIDRQPDSKYIISNFGKLLLRFLMVMERSTQLKSYILEHRIGGHSDLFLMLNDVKLIANGLEVIEAVYRIVENAKRMLYVFVEGILHLLPRIQRHLTHIEDVRLLIPNAKQELCEDFLKILLRKFDVKIKVLNVKLNEAADYCNLLINDDAVICFFPTHDGVMDLNQAIVSDDYIFRQLSLMKFHRFWSQSKYIPEILFDIA